VENSDIERRSSRRDEVSLDAVVKGRESAAEFWNEETRIVTVSRLGASFNLSRECSVGRILSMIFKMPREFRCYDHNKKLYRVWGLVQHCSALTDENDYQIGIAFIGKFAPQSYLKDPLKTYRIVGMDDDGFWNVGETKAPFVSRAYHRFPSALGVRLAKIDDENEESEVDHDAVTENISAGGASVYSSLEVETGDPVSFKCELNGWQSLAVVRNRQTREGDRTTIHLEFSRLFPVKELDLSFEDADPEELAETTEVTDEMDSESLGPGDAEIEDQDPGAPVADSSSEYDVDDEMSEIQDPQNEEDDRDADLAAESEFEFESFSQGNFDEDGQSDAEEDTSPIDEELLERGVQAEVIVEEGNQEGSEEEEDDQFERF